MKTVVLYDGHCVLCRQSIRLLRWTDWLRRIEPLDAQNQPQVRERYPDLTHEELMGAIHAITADERVLVGFFAMRYLARFVPLMWPMLPLLYLPGMNWLGPRLYRWVARRRYAINRLFGGHTCENDVCQMH